jgi:hypothetical protein
VGPVYSVAMKSPALQVVAVALSTVEFFHTAAPAAPEDRGRSVSASAAVDPVVGSALAVETQMTQVGLAWAVVAVPPLRAASLPVR